MAACLYHGLGLLQLFAVAHHLGRQLAQRNHVLSETHSGWVGDGSRYPGFSRFWRAVRYAAFAALQARYSQTGMAGGMDPLYPLARSVLDHRAEFLEHFSRDRGRHRCIGRDWLPVDGLFLPQSGFTASVADV